MSESDTEREKEIMRRCSECNKRIFLSSPIPGLCTSCYQRQQEEEARRVLEEQQREEERKRLEEEKRKREGEEAFQRLVSAFAELGSSESLIGPDAYRRRATQLEAFVSDFHAFLERPDAASFIKINEDRSFLDYAYVIGFGPIKYERLSKEDVKLNFQEILDKKTAMAEEYRRIADNSDQFLSFLSALPAANVSICDDPGETCRTPGVPPQSSNITKRTPISKAGDFVVIDVETTGLRPDTDEIIELAAIRFYGFEPDSIFHTYVKPRNGIKQAAQAVNGITWDMVKDAPYFEQISASFNEFIGDKLSIVAHNVPFDYRFLTAVGVARPLIAMKRNFYDTLDLARREYSVLNSFKLPDLCHAILKISVDNMHTAYADALATGLIYKEICKRRMGI